MSDRPVWPEPVSRYLESVRREIASLPAGYRDDVLSGIEAHLTDSLADGLDPSEVMAALGTPDSLAGQAFEQYHQETASRPAYFTPRRIAQLVAFALMIAGLIFALVFPVSTEFRGDAEGVTEVIRHTQLEDRGPIVFAVGALFLVLAGVPLLLRGRAWRRTSIFLTVVLAVFAVAVSMVSTIGVLLAAATAVVALFLPARQNGRLHPPVAARTALLPPG